MPEVMPPNPYAQIPGEWGMAAFRGDQQQSIHTFFCGLLIHIESQHYMAGTSSQAHFPLC
eukprot:12919327-Prorocentrum_lima.AAC.1